MSAVHLAVVGDEMQAEVICGRLRAEGVKCDYRRTDMAAATGTFGGGFSMGGPTEILVDSADLATARDVLKRSER